MSSDLLDALEWRLSEAVEDAVRRAEQAFRQSVYRQIPAGKGVPPEIEAALPRLREYWAESARDDQLRRIANRIFAE